MVPVPYCERRQRFSNSVPTTAMILNFVRIVSCVSSSQNLGAVPTPNNGLVHDMNRSWVSDLTSTFDEHVELTRYLDRIRSCDDALLVQVINFKDFHTKAVQLRIS